ncbi:MAG TPA: cbb3-type cytochrome c oxidase N-terminal domain-containing protein [Flavobacteriales bacterium]|nr:cbb3-type cytochrome c oxidase N-terminal domain-containing protein [Flavobacteriales bacterium]HQW42140.1 cbb3-type cytochrome c oxidase N-terminal domain-containing protein [Flavobacteriales bacterium]
MPTDRTTYPTISRNLLAALVLVPLSASAETGAAPIKPLVQVDTSLIYALLALAVVQVIFILAMAGIMRTMAGPGAWVNWLSGKGGKAAVLLPFLLLLAPEASAQAFVDNSATITNYQLFWLLAAINLFLFVIVLAQISVLRGLTRAITGSDPMEEAPEPPKGPTWLEKIMAGLTRQVPVEKEQDILLNHDYDGIHELDNVLPPWWLWLFYFTIAWGVVYLINVHVINVVPDQDTEYAQEMEQAKIEVAAYMATLKTSVDETNVTVSDDPSVLSSGKAIFTQYCTPCHGADGAGSETSVGPNLTDAYWMHGGDVKDVFKTVKYGVPEKGMISWKSQIKPVEIAAVVNYILSLKGTGGPTQKAPQGDLWQEGGNSAAPTDSVTTAADTARLAVR